MKWHHIKYKLKWLIIKTNLFKHAFNVAGFIYVDTFRNPVNDITKEVEWLGTVNVKCHYKNIDKKAIEAFGNIYPQYREYINIYGYDYRKRKSKEI